MRLSVITLSILTSFTLQAKTSGDQDVLKFSDSALNLVGLSNISTQERANDDLYSVYINYKNYGVFRTYDIDNLCFSSSILTEILGGADDSYTCLIGNQNFSSITVDRKTKTVSVSTFAATEDTKDYSDIGGFLNYTLSSFSGENYKRNALYSDLGINISNTKFRTKFTVNDDVDIYSYYVEKESKSNNYRMQIGEVYSDNSFTGGVRHHGINYGFGSELSNGVVNLIISEDSNVEMYQNGILVSHSDLGPGPTSIKILLMDNTSDLQVIETNKEGNQKIYYIPIDEVRVVQSDISSRSGYNLSLGKYVNYDDYSYLDSLYFGSIESSFFAFDNIYSYSALLSKDYYHLGFRGNIFNNLGLSFSVSNTSQNTYSGSKSGSEIELKYELSNNDFRNYINLRGYIGDYVQFSDAIRTNIMSDSYTKLLSNLSIGTQYNNDQIGRLGFSVNNRIYDQNHGSDLYLSANYNKFTNLFGNINFSIRKNFDSQTNDDLNMSLNISKSFGNGKSVRYYSVLDNDNYLNGVGYSSNINQNTRLDIASQFNNDLSISNARATVSSTPKYFNVRAGVSTTNQGSSSFNSNVNGSVAVTSNGIGFSKHKIYDSFGIIKIDSDDKSSITNFPIVTPGGKNYASPLGHAVYSSNSAGSGQIVSIDDVSSIPNTEIVSHNAYHLNHEHGSVINDVSFKLVSIENVLVYIEDSSISDGDFIFSGESLLGQVDDGKVFIRKPISVNTFRIEKGDNKQCNITLDKIEYFENRNYGKAVVKCI